MTDFLKSVFANLRIGFKSVKNSLGQYASFFAALFLIQCFFGMLTTSAKLNSDITEKIILEEYDYDIVLLGMDNYQKTFLENDELTVFRSDRVYDIVRIVENATYGSAPTFDIYIDFSDDDPEQGLSRFKSRYLPYLTQYLDSGEGVSLNYSERYKLDDYLASITVGNIAFSLLMAIVSILLIISLYRIRLNHYRFTYGIYMTFGADFRQLTKTAFFEMTVVSLITFIPSQIFSNLVVYFIYQSADFPFSYDPYSALRVFLINLIVVALSVLLPMRRISRTMPTNLLTAEDNSNLVVSPRRSFNFFKLNFPKKYELASMWRFRKYLAVMLATAVGFASVFCALTYVAHFYRYTLEYSDPQFTLTVEASAAEDETFLPDLAELDGVYRYAAYAAGDAKYNRSHVLYPKSALVLGANSKTVSGSYSDAPGMTDYRAANDIEYILPSRSLFDTLTSDLFDYEITGDPYKVLTDDTAVVVTNFIGNQKIANFKVGDKINVGAFAYAHGEFDYNLQGLDRLRGQLKAYTFDYTELTVCAVIDGMDTLEAAPIYVPASVYSKVTAEVDALINTVDVYVSPDCTAQAARTAFEELRLYCSIYESSVSVSDNHVVAGNMIERSGNYYALIIAISFLVLGISPLIWFFSQVLFMKKREKEFSVLMWLGALRSDIKKLASLNGVLIAAIASVLCSALSLGAIALIQLAVTRVPPLLYGAQQSYYFGVYIPVPALIFGVLLSLLCGYFSTTLPVGSFTKHFYDTARNHEFGGDD